jgi:hypothetical protein
MPRRLKTEQPHQVKAFERYYALGEKRTYTRLAADLGLNVSTVKLWGRSFDWAGRIRERDAEVARQMADRTIKDGLADNERNLKIVRIALLRLAKAIADGQVKMQMGDLDRLIRLEHQLAGRPLSSDGSESERMASNVHIYIPDNQRGDGKPPIRRDKPPLASKDATTEDHTGDLPPDERDKT